MKIVVGYFFFLFPLCSCSQAIKLKYSLFTSSEGFDTSGAVPAIELAEEMVNGTDSILPGYTLEHDEIKDTKCNRANSLRLFFETISPENLPVLGLLGCGCSVASTPVAEVVHYKSMSQVSYVSTSVELDNGVRFPNFFRTHPSDAEFTPVFLSVIKQYGWKRVAFLTQDEGLFTGAYERLIEDAADMNVTLQNRLFPSEFPVKELTSKNFFFEEENYRVLFINAYSDFAQHIICEAFRRDYTYPRYAWILYGWYEENWWTQIRDIDCTRSQLERVLNRALSILVFAVASNQDAMTDTRLTPRQFNDMYRKRLESTNYTYSFSGSLAYDGLWSLAFALNKTNTMLQSMTREEVLNVTGCAVESGIHWELVPLENFTNDNELMGCVIRWNLQRTDFVGVSGRVQFNDVGSRFQAHSQIFQYRLNKSSSILHQEYIGLTESDDEDNKTVILFLNNESVNTVFPEKEGGIPLDGTPITQINGFHLALVGTYYSLAALGIVFSTVCLIFNFTQRNKKIIRLTSPNLNYFLIAGTYLMFLSVFCRLIPSTSYSANYARCLLDVTVDTIGYCLAFGVVLAKMGRIHYIFKNPTPTQMAVKDWQLILVTLIVTGAGLVLVFLQVVVPQFRPDPELISDEEAGTELNMNGIIINTYFYACFPAENQVLTWIIVTFLYLALLQVIGIILTVQTRKVKVKVLNDSKHIAALIYISSIVLVTRAVAVFAVNHLLNVAEVIFSGGIIVLGFAFLSLVFIPKMVSLVKDPNGENIFTQGDTTLTASMNSRRRIGVVDGEQADGSKVKQLETKIVQLEAELEHQKQNDEGTSFSYNSESSHGPQFTVISTNSKIVTIL